MSRRVGALLTMLLVLGGIGGGVAAGVGMASAFAQEGGRNWLQFGIWAIWTPTMVLLARRAVGTRSLALPCGVLGALLAVFYAIGGAASPLLDGVGGAVFVALAVVAFLWLVGSLWRAWRQGRVLVDSGESA